MCVCVRAFHVCACTCVCVCVVCVWCKYYSVPTRLLSCRLEEKTSVSHSLDHNMHSPSRGYLRPEVRGTRRGQAVAQREAPQTKAAAPTNWQRPSRGDTDESEGHHEPNIPDPCN